jgi:phage shock protein A
MTEQHQVQTLVATLRDALSQLAGALERTREGVDAITSQVARLREGIETLGALRQREVPAVGVDMVIDAAAELLAAFRDLETGIRDAQGDVDTLEAAMADDEAGHQD